MLLPIGKRKEYPELVLTVIYAHERDQSQRRDKIDLDCSPISPSVRAYGQHAETSAPAAAPTTASDPYSRRHLYSALEESAA